METSPACPRPSRREFSALALATPFLARPSVLRQAAEEPRFVDPPAVLAGEARARLDALAAELAGKKTTAEAVLADPAWTALRPASEFRQLIERHATGAKLALVPRGEPGEALHVAGRLVDKDGQARAGATVYAYQTSAKGWYAAEAPHFGGNSGDVGHARLFGYGRTDAEGRWEIASVRPGGYPRSTLPCHIHIHFYEPEKRGGPVNVSEIRFEDDPRLTPEEREDSLRVGYRLVTPERKDGVWRCAVEFTLARA